MSDSELQRIERRYQASLSMLETIETALETVAQKSAVLSDLDLTDRFGADLRRLARSLAGDEPTEKQEHAFEILFDESLSETPGPAFAGRPDPEDVVDDVVEYLEWVANLEERIGGSIGGGAALSGLTAGIADTVTAVGSAIASRADDQPVPDRHLEDLEESIESLLARPELEQEPPDDLSP